MSSIAQLNTTISGPEVPEENGDARAGLREDLIGDSLLIRAQIENAHVIEPCRYRVAHAVGQVIASGQIDLVPVTLSLDARAHFIAEDSGCKVCYGFSE